MKICESALSGIGKKFEIITKEDLHETIHVVEAIDSSIPTPLL